MTRVQITVANFQASRTPLTGRCLFYLSVWQSWKALGRRACPCAARALVQCVYFKLPQSEERGVTLHPPPLLLSSPRAFWTCRTPCLPPATLRQATLYNPGARCFPPARAGWVPLHPSRACTVEPAYPWGWWTCWLPGPAPAAGARGLCSKYTGNNQRPLPARHSFCTEIRKTWGSLGHIPHRTADTAPALVLKGNLRQTFKRWTWEWKFVTLQSTKNQEFSGDTSFRIYYFPLTQDEPSILCNIYSIQ